jgi:predicted ribosomally synthesized peptide with SipW-like signal peptide
MRLTTKLLASVLVVGTVGSLSVTGVFGAFSSVTSSDGNEIRTGTVVLDDNDAGSSMSFVNDAAPGTSVTSCIKVSYNGSLPAAVGLYAQATAPFGSLAQYVDVTITQGTQVVSTFPDCTGFTPSVGGGLLFTGTLEALLGTRTNFLTGIVTAPAAAWQSGDALVYRVQETVNLATPSGEQAATTGPHSFVWEARDI